MVQRQALDSDSGWQGCMRDLNAQLQEAHGLEKKLQDEARNLRLRTQESTSQAGLQLSEAQRERVTHHLMSLQTHHRTTG